MERNVLIYAIHVYIFTHIGEGCKLNGAGMKCRITKCRGCEVKQNSVKSRNVKKIKFFLQFADKLNVIFFHKLSYTCWRRKAIHYLAPMVLDMAYMRAGCYFKNAPALPNLVIFLAKNVKIKLQLWQIKRFDKWLLAILAYFSALPSSASNPDREDLKAKPGDERMDWGDVNLGHLDNISFC